MWFDSHCHLYDLGDGPAVAAAVARAREAAVEDVLVPGVDAGSSRRAIDLAIDHNLWAAVGIHPSEVSGWAEEWMDSIRALLAQPRVVGVGETGLDFYRGADSRVDQERNFAAHIELAATSSKALIIHTRASAGAALDMLEHHGMPASVIFHCWSGNRVELQRALSLGAFISFAGNVSFKNAEPLRAAAREVPSDQIMVETDAPYLTPVPHRGGRNEPAYVALVGAAVAEARGESVEELAAATSANTRRAFGLDPP